MHYVVAGDGTAPPKEITATLDELYERIEKATAPEDDLYFSVSMWIPTEAGKAHTTIATWCNQRDIPWDAIGPGSQNEDFADADNWYVDSAMIDILGFANEVAAGDTVQVLALYVDANNPGADEDVELDELVELALKSGLECYALNAQMYPLAFAAEAEYPEAADTEEAPEPEPEPEPEVDPIEAERERLQALPRTELQAMAKEVGATPKDFRKKQNLVDAILAVEESNETESPDMASPEAPTLGVPDLDEAMENIRKAEEVPSIVGLTETDVRRIVREELSTAIILPSPGPDERHPET